MKKNIAHILEQALRLPPEARAALAGALLDSLDETLDREAESAWAAEIDKAYFAIRAFSPALGSL